MGLHSSAAQLSTILKLKRSTKTARNPLAKSSGKKSLSSFQKPKNEAKEALEVVEHNIQMDFKLENALSIVKAIDVVSRNQWAECTIFHDRYYSPEAKISAKNPRDFLFLLRGISMEAKADISRYRALQLPSAGLLTVNQLYTLFESKGNTFVDRSLELFIRDGQVRKFVITNALPVILTTVNRGFGDHVTYGYENAEVVVNTRQYLGQISESMAHVDSNAAQIISKFKHFIEQNPTILFVTNEEFSSSELSTLVDFGLLTLTSNHNFEIEVFQYSIAYPRCGSFLKIINSGRNWLVKTLSKTYFKEALEESLFQKWEGKIMANFRKPFYGYDLLWVLADAKGAGLVEAFDTPIGRGWKLTGKL